MKFDLRRPCKDCPFRTDCMRGWLRRAPSIADEVGREGKTFACHKTTTAGGRMTGDEQHCAGAAIIQERRPEGPGQMLQIAGRLGLYDHAILDMDAPVFPTFDDFIAHHLDEEGGP